MIRNEFRFSQTNIWVAERIDMNTEYLREAVKIEPKTINEDGVAFKVLVWFQGRGFDEWREKRLTRARNSESSLWILIFSNK